MRQALLVTMNQWRNAVAHQDFSRPELGGRNQLTLAEVRRWRSACERLAVDFERVMHHLSEHRHGDCALVAGRWR